MRKPRMTIIPLILLLLVSVMAFVGVSHSLNTVKAVIDEDVTSFYSNNDTLIVDTPADWRRLTKLSSAHNFLNKTIILNCDIDLQMHPYSFVYFYGTFEGNGHSVYNAQKPLFSEIRSSAIVRNLHFYNAYINSYSSVIAQTNLGLIQNVTANGYIEGQRISGLVDTNNGNIIDCISYVFLKDNSQTGTATVGGLTCFNNGNIQNSHYIGKQYLTNNVDSGGIAAINIGTIEKCSSRIDYDIDIIKSIDNMEKVGGIVASNGMKTDTIHIGYIKNSFSIINVNYISIETLDFIQRPRLCISGLIGQSNYTYMSFCYSDVTGEGNLFGIIRNTSATPIEETITPEPPEEPYNIITGYLYHGSESITNCFSVATLQPVLVRPTHSGLVYEELSLSCQTITQTQLLNNESTYLRDLLQNDDATWVGESGQFPTCSPLYEGMGNSDNPYVIKTKEDIYKLQAFMYYQSLSVYFQQYSFIDFSYTALIPFDLSMAFTGYYNGNDFTIHNFNSQALFQKNIGTIENLGFIDGNKDNVIAIDRNSGLIRNCYSDNKRYGTIYNNPKIYQNQDFVKAQTFGYTGVESIINITSSDAFESGNGTSADPYVIKTPEQLARIGTLSSYQYAVIENDIVVNNSTDLQKYRLNIGGFSGNLNGKGHTIIGLINESLINVLTGSVSDLNIRGIITNSDYVGLVANTVGALGQIQNIMVYGSISGSESGGIAGTNEGIISLCSNYASVFGNNSSGICGLNSGNISKCSNKGKSVYGIAVNSSSASIQNCFDEGNTLSIYNNVGNIVSSVAKKQSSVELWHNNSLIHSDTKITVNDLRVFSDYSLNIWGYTIDENNYPILKENRRFFKEDLARDYFNRNLSHNRVYNPDIITEIGDIEAQLVINDLVRDQIAFEWYYDDILFDTQLNPYIINAGIYKVNAIYSGNNYINSYIYTYQITISKAALPNPDFYGDSGIPGMHTPYIYDGQIYDITQIKATNLETLGISTSDYSYSIKYNFETVDNIIHVGYYDVTVIIDNVNYTMYTGKTVIEIKKANLSITIDNKEIDYLACSPAFTYSIEVQTNPWADTETITFAYQLAQTALSSGGGRFLCDYEEESDTGEYQINYEVFLDNYNVIVNPGVLTVNALALTEENIVFTDKEYTYTGYVIQLNAQITDSDISVQYENNDNISAGSYVVNAIFSKQNYTDLLLSRTLTITKAPLVIKPKNQDIIYGQTTPEFTLDEIVFLGDDDSSCLIGESIFYCNYIQGDNTGTYEISVSGLSAYNYELSFEKGTLTVNKALMTDLFSYDNISYVYDGQHKTNPIDLLDYTTTATYTYYYQDVQLSQPPKDAGVYEVIALVQAINSNYENTPFNSFITINKESLEVYFLAEYILNYNGESRNLDYEGSLPEGEDFVINQWGKDEHNQTFHSFKDASTYNVTMTFSGNNNFNEMTITTILIIQPIEVEVLIVSDAIYNKTFVTPEYEYLQQIFEGDTIELEWEYSIFGYGYDSAFPNVINAGKYTCYPKSLNKNYVITNTPEFNILKHNIMFTPRYVEFIYGDYGEFEYNSRVFISGKNYMIQKNYYIEATLESVDVEYYYGGPNAGTYSVTGAKDTSNYDFEIVSGANKIRVIRRDLTYYWNDVNFALEYNGEAQMPFVLTLGNIVTGESVSTNLVSNGNNKDAGTYIISAELIYNQNYRLNAQSVTLTITKAPLTIKADDKYVVQGTQNVMFTATVTGLKGTDTLTSMGRQLNFYCSYSMTSPAGLVLPITIESFTLNNYDIDFVTGTLRVTSNDYPPMSLPSKTFVYDGNVKALTLDRALPTGATVTYQNNFQKDVGVYNVTARVIFPNSTIQNLSGTLIITKATPELFVNDIVRPYYIFAKLKNDDIIGIAKLNDNEIIGSFSFTGNVDLKTGVNKYEVLFTPQDANNINSATTLINVEGKVIREQALAFDKSNVVLIDNNIYIKEQTVLSLSEGYQNLTLYLDDSPKESISLDRTGEYNIYIKYNNETVFSKKFNVKLQKNDDDEPPEIPHGLEKFEIIGGTINDEDTVGQILIDIDKINIKINEDYSEDMELFLNGTKVTYIEFYGDEGSATIQVKYKGILIYAKTFEIKIKPQPQPEEPKDEWLWAKITAGVVGGIILILLIILGIRHFNKVGKKGYNPYEAAERKRKKLKRKFK